MKLFWLLYVFGLFVVAAVHLWGGDMVGAVAGLALAFGLVQHLRINILENDLMSLKKRGES